MALFTSTFSHDLIKKYTIVFGSLFDGIKHQNFAENGDILSEVKVPVTYAPKEKVLARLRADPELDRPMAISLPIISFQLMNISYAPARKLNTMNKIVTRDADNASVVRSVYNPVPYDFHFQVIVYSKFLNDGAKIIEQILPFFTPDFVPTIHLIPDMNIKADIPIVLNSVEHNEEYEAGQWEAVRASLWTLNFTVKGFLYGPMTHGAVIKFVEVNLLNYSNTTISTNVSISNTKFATITVQPGMTANGEPTSNIAETVSYTLINASDSFDYITVITEYPNG